MKVRVRMDVIVEVHGTTDRIDAEEVVYLYFCDQDFDTLLEQMSFLADDTVSPASLHMYPDDEEVPLQDGDNVTTLTKPNGETRRFGIGWSTYHR